MYQEYLANSLTEKYTALNAELDKVVHDANVEITNLRGKLQSVLIDMNTVAEWC